MRRTLGAVLAVIAAIAAAYIACFDALSAADAATLFGLVNTGELFASTDTGVNWEVRSTLSVHDAVGLVAGATSDDLFLVTRSGVVYRSTDAGVNWSTVGGVPAPDVEALAMRQDATLLVLTATGTVWASEDQGATFTPIATLTASNHVSLARAGSGPTLYALSATGEVAESVDGGANWLPKGVITVPDAVEIVRFGSPLFVLSGTGEIARSTDAGATWQAIGTLSQVHMSGLTTDPTSNLLVAVTREGEVATSPNGVAWTWVGTINQLAVATLANDNPTPTGVEEDAPMADFRVGLPYPNPAPAVSEATTIPFSLQRGDTVRLEVFDAAGRLVARRAPQQFGPGGHRLDMGAPGLPSGLYFARLATGSGLVAEARWTLLR